MKNNILFVVLLGLFSMGFHVNVEAQTCQSFSASIISTSHTLDAQNTVVVCPEEEVVLQIVTNYSSNNMGYFQSDVTTEFNWYNNPEPNGLGLVEYTVSYNEPGIYPVTCMPIDVNGCSPDSAAIAYVLVAAPSDVEFNIEPNQVDYCEGDLVEITANPIFENYIVSNLDTITFTYLNDSLLFLPDGSGVSYQAPINVPAFMDGFQTQITDIIVCLDIEHSFTGDLDISLTCPDDLSASILSYPNSAGGAFLGEPNETDEGTGVQPSPGTPYQYCFQSDSLLTYIDNAGINMNNSIIPGTYRTENSLQNLISCMIGGDWELEISDNIDVDNGVLFSWSIGFVVENQILNQGVDFDSIVLINSLQNLDWEMPNGTFASQDTLNVQLALGDTFTILVGDEYGCVYSEQLDMVIHDTSDISSPCYPCIPPPTNHIHYLCPDESSFIYQNDTITTAGNYTINSIPPYCSGSINLIVIEQILSEYELEILPAADSMSMGQVSLVMSPEYTFIDGSTSMPLGIGNHNVTILYNGGECDFVENIEIPVYQELQVSVSLMDNFVSNQTQTATVNISDGLPPYDIEWSTGDMNVVSVSGLADGSYWVKVLDSFGEMIIENFNIITVSVDESYWLKSLNLFPNPTDETLNIDIQLEQNSEIEISVFEISGREVRKYNYSGTSLEKTLDVSSLGSGVYFINIQTEKDRIVRKITIL